MLAAAVDDLEIRLRFYSQSRIPQHQLADRRMRSWECGSRETCSPETHSCPVWQHRLLVLLASTAHCADEDRPPRLLLRYVGARSVQQSIAGPAWALPRKPFPRTILTTGSRSQTPNVGSPCSVFPLPVSNRCGRLPGGRNRDNGRASNSSV